MMHMMTLPPMIFPVGVVSLEKAFGGDIIQMIVNAGPMVKFVLLILLFFSIVSWAIIFMKWSLLRKAKRETIFFLDLFWQSVDLDDIFHECDNLRYSPVVHVFKSGYSEIRRVSKINNRPTTDEGNKGEEAALAALEKVSLLRRIDR